MQDNNQSQFSTLVKDLYSKYSPEKVDKLDEETLSNIEKTYNGDYKTFVSDYYKKNRPDKVDQLNDEAYANIAKTYGFGQNQQSGGAGQGQEIDKKEGGYSSYRDPKIKEDWLADSKVNQFIQSNSFLRGAYQGGKQFIGGVGLWLEDMAQNLINDSTGGMYVGEDGKLVAPWDENYKKPEKSDAYKEIRTWQEKSPKMQGGVGEFLGQLAPQTAAVATVVLSRNPALGKAYLGTMTGSSYGMGLQSYDEYIEETGAEYNENDRYATAVAYSAAEIIGEKIGLDYFMPKGMSKVYGKILSKTLGKSPEMSMDVGESIIRNYAKKNNLSVQAAKKILTGGFVEGGQESATETMQIAADMWLTGRDVEGKEIRDRLLTSFAGGAVMGATIGPFSAVSQNAANKQRRREQGQVTLSVDGKGNAIELVEGDGEVYGITPEGEVQNNIDEETISKSVTIPTELFEESINKVKENEELPAPLKKSVEANNAIKRIQEAIAPITHKDGNVHQITNEQDEMFFVVDETDGGMLTVKDIAGNEKIVAADEFRIPEVKSVQEITEQELAAWEQDYTLQEQMKAEQQAIQERYSNVPEQWEKDGVTYRFVNDPQNITPDGNIVVEATDQMGNVTPKEFTQEEINSVIQEQNEAAQAEQEEAAKLQEEQQGEQADEQEVIEKPKQTFKIDNKEFEMEQAEDGSFILNAGQKDLKTIQENTDTDNFDVELITEDVPADPNVPAFVKQKPKQNIKGVKITPKQKQNDTAAPSEQNILQQYTLLGEQIDEKKANALVDMAESVEDLYGFEFANDERISKKIEKKFPELNPVYEVAGQKVDREYVENAIEFANTPEKLQKIKVKNDQELQALIEEKEAELRVPNAKEVKKKALEAEPRSVRELLLQYFVNNGKIHTSDIRKELTGSSKGEQASRLGFTSNDAPTIDQLQEKLLSGTPFEQMMEDPTAFRNEVIEVLSSYQGRAKMLEDISELALTDEQQYQADMAKHMLKVKVERVVEGNRVKFVTETDLNGIEVDGNDYNEVSQTETTPEEDQFAASLPDEYFLPLLEAENDQPSLEDIEAYELLFNQFENERQKTASTTNTTEEGGVVSQSEENGIAQQINQTARPEEVEAKKDDIGRRKQEAKENPVPEPISYKEAVEEYKSTDLGSNKDAKRKKQRVVDEAQTKEGRAFVENQVAQLETNDDGTITVYRSGTMQEGHNPATTDKNTAEVIAAERKKQGLSSDIIEVRVQPTDISAIIPGIESEVFIKVNADNKNRISDSTKKPQKTKNQIIKEKENVKIELDEVKQKLLKLNEDFKNGKFPFSEKVYNETKTKQEQKIKNLEWQLTKYDAELAGLQKNTTSEKQNTQELTESKTQQLETEQQAENQEVQSEPENETSYDENEDLFTNIERIVEKDDLKKEEAKVETNPSEAQKEAGNYKKGHVNIQGFDITIENPKGSTRSGVDESGKPWSITMNNTYGYFKRTKGKDGDQIDVFLGDNFNSDKVFVIDQNNEDGSFDESKVMLGFDTAEQAQENYMKNYSPGWKGFGAITESNVENFKGWLKDGARQNKAYSEYRENQSVDTNAKVEGRKPIDKNVDASLLAKSISTAFADAFSTFKASQERLIKAQNDFLKLKNLTLDEFNALSEDEKSKLKVEAKEFLNKQESTPQKGDKIKFTLGGKEYTLPSGDYIILPNGRVQFDLFGQKILNRDQYEIVGEVKPEVKPVPTTEKPVEKIEDFGEKIEGAKKDIYQRMQSVTESDILSQPLSKSFPRPDFVQMVNEGMLSESKTQQAETEQQDENQETKSEPEKTTSYDENEDLFTNIEKIVEKVDNSNENRNLAQDDEVRYKKISPEVSSEDNSPGREQFGEQERDVRPDRTTGNIPKPGTIKRQAYDHVKRLVDNHRIKEFDAEYFDNSFDELNRKFPNRSITGIADLIYEGLPDVDMSDGGVRFKKADDGSTITPNGQTLLEWAGLPMVDEIKTKEQVADYNARVEILNGLYKAGVLNEDNVEQIEEEYTIALTGDNRWFDEIVEEKMEELEDVEFGTSQKQEYSSKSLQKLSEEGTIEGLEEKEQPIDYLDELDFDVNNMTIEDLIIQSTGITESLDLAGYIMPNGDLLDFSEGQGDRYRDHRTLGIPTVEEVQGTELMDRFMNTTGAVRTDGARGSVQLNKMPTDAQRKHIKEIIRRNSGNYNIDLYDGTRKLSITNVPMEFALDKIEEFYNDESIGNSAGGDVIRFRKTSPQGFYSTVENALDKINQEKGTPEQFKAMLLKNGAKQAEMDWMIEQEDFPSGKSITKADIQNWIDQNKIEVEEVEKGTTNPRAVNKNDVKSVRFKDFGGGSYVVDFGGEIGDIEISTNEAINEEEAIQAAIERANFDNTEYLVNKPKYQQYQLPGGENYKEFVLTMPGQIEPYKPDNIHFTDEGGGTAVVWVRANERTANDERILFLEEIQSKRGQDGKQEGFKGDYKNKSLVEPVLNKTLQSALEKTGGNWMPAFHKSELTPEEELLHNEWVKLDNKRHENNRLIPSMPFSKTDQWVNLALRRMMRYAAENGFDRIAWTPGEVQADRYDLSKQVDVVFHKKNEDGTYRIEALPKGAGSPNAREVVSTNAKESELEGVVGKDLAQKIIDTPKSDETFGGMYAKKGADLKVGGEGMKSFYDKIVPNQLKKITKKFDAKIEPTTVDLNGGINLDLATDAISNLPSDGQLEVLSIPVTDKMRESVMEGIPLFKRTQHVRPIKSENKEIADELTKTQMRAPNALPLVVGNDKAELVQAMAENGSSVQAVKAVMQASPFKAFVDTRTGHVYVDLSMHNSKDDALISWIHENQHKGIRNLIPDSNELNQFFDTLYESVRELAKTDPMYTRVLSEVERLYAGESGRVKGDELFSHLSEKILNKEDLTPQERTIWQKLVDGIRDILSKIFNFDAKLLSHQDIASIIRASMQTNFQGNDTIQDNVQNNRGREDSPVTRDTQRPYREGGSAENVSGRERTGDILYDKTGEEDVFEVAERTKYEPTRSDIRNRQELERAFNRADNKKSLREINQKPRKEDYDSIFEFAQALADYEDSQRFRKSPQTDTPEFKRWFGDSKVVDENGDPLVVYHGTPYVFNEFSKKEKGKRTDHKPDDVGFHFSNDPEFADTYAGTSEIKLFEAYSRMFGELPDRYSANVKPNIMPVYLSIQNPLKQYDSFVINKELIDQAKKTGHDGIFAQVGDRIEYVAFEPTQIKSATGNNGGFDPNNPDIRFRKDDEQIKNELESAIEEIRKGKSKKHLKEAIYNIRQLIQDKDLPVRRFLKEIAGGEKNVKSHQNAYRDMTLAFGRSEYLLNELADKHMNPVVDAAAKLKKHKGIDNEAIMVYMIAKHAPERNRKIRDDKVKEYIYKNKDASDEQIDAYRKSISGRDYSGILSVDKSGEYEGRPDEYAELLSIQFEGKIDNEKEIGEFWKAIKGVSNYTLERWKDGNQITTEGYELMKNGYDFYVPLKGWWDDASKVHDYHGAGSGAGKSLKKAEGRLTLPDNPLAYLEQQAFKSITEQVDNEVYRTMLSFVTSNMKGNEDRVQVKKIYYVQKGDGEWDYTLERPEKEMFDNGMAEERRYTDHFRMRKPAHAKQHEVWVDTKYGTYAMVFPEDVEVAHALNHSNTLIRGLFGKKEGTPLDLENINRGFSRTIGRITNLQKALYTSWNIVFPVKNLLRDAPEAASHMTIKYGPKMAAKFMSEYGKPGAVLRYLYNKEKFNPKWDEEGNPQNEDAFYDDFMSNGGQTGFTHLKEPDVLMREIHDRIKKAGNKYHKKSLTDNLERFSQIFEDMTRFSAYKAGVKSGMTKKDAAALAKEVSVNFNRKGKITKTFDAIYAFFNAALQAGHKNLKLAKDNPKAFFAVSAGWTLLGIMVAEMNRAMDDDDDEEYERLSPYVRMNYLVFPIGGGKYFRLPLPQFFRGFYAMGSNISDLRHGKTSLGAAIGDGLLNFLNALSPIDVSGFVDSDRNFSISPLVPTAADPIVEAYITNENFMGYPISKEPFTQHLEDVLADSKLHKKNVNPAIKFFTDNLFELGGGETDRKTYRDPKTGEQKRVPFMMDLNPSKIEHLIKSYTGGTGAFVTDLGTTLMNATENKYDIDDMPYINSFVRNYPDKHWDIIGDYYDEKEKDTKWRDLANSYKKKGDMEVYLDMSEDINKLERHYTLKIIDDKLSYLDNRRENGLVVPEDEVVSKKAELKSAKSPWADLVMSEEEYYKAKADTIVKYMKTLK